MLPVAAIRDAIKAKPFRPFTVHLADERTFPVPHAEFVSIEPQNRALLIWREDEGMSLLDMREIAGIELAASASKEG